MSDEKSIATQILQPDGSTLPATFALQDGAEGDRRVTLRLVFGERQLAETADTYYEAMLHLRETLEGEGMLLCCNGAAENTHPSGMMLDIARSAKCFALCFTPLVPTEWVRSSCAGNSVCCASQNWH